ncbi:hypothetical protein Ddye_024826 [Dipteronia dyeriana]|uniref:hAT-like transposase RNase-H fold domain-containing protein n=1 Tax=Dipteronia dyeriana TaxID=168575 RepID=A0AAD9TW68_9ROSI|nr:hypothetical protein Ddye_024826 [Dipteronia dyeriana]
MLDLLVFVLSKSLLCLVFVLFFVLLYSVRGLTTAALVMGFVPLMEIDPNASSMEGSSELGPKTLENSSSIGKGKVSEKGKRLQKRILSFRQIVDHKGDSIGKCIENVLLEWGIDKVFTITVDNAIANTIAIGYVIRKLNSWQDDGAVLGGNDGLKDLHDSIVAIRNAVKYVKSSPSRLDRFKKAIAHEKIETKGLVVLDVPTRWNSTYLMLESVVKLRKAFERMGEEDLHYVNYFRDDDQSEQKRIGPPNCDNWDNAKGLEQTNNLLILAVFLDPRYKLGYVKFWFDSIYGVEESQSMIFKLKGVGSGPSDDIEFGRLKATDKEDSLWGMKQQKEDVNKGKSEVDLYLLERP